MFQFFVTFAHCFLFKRRKNVSKSKLHLHRSRRRFRVRSSDWYHTKALCLNFQENKPISLCRKYPARCFRKSVKTCYLKKVDHCYPSHPEFDMPIIASELAPNLTPVTGVCLGPLMVSLPPTIFSPGPQIIQISRMIHFFFNF